MDTPPTSALCLSQKTLSMAMSGMEASGQSMPLSHHHLHHPRHIDPEEEGQEAEEERKRGDATPDDSHLVMYISAAAASVVPCYYTRIYQYTIVSHSTSSSQLIVPF